MRFVALTLTLFVSSPILAQRPEWIGVTAMGGASPESWHGRAAMSAISFELGRSISPRTEVSVAITPSVFDQPVSWFGDEFGDGNEDVRALGASVMIRRRLRVRSSAAQFYGEVGTGPMWAEKAVPAATSRFNFVTQFGAGIILRPASRFPVVAGYRWVHVSNGGYSPRNPGLNISSFVIGFRVVRK